MCLLNYSYFRRQLSEDKELLAPGSQKEKKTLQTRPVILPVL